MLVVTAERGDQTKKAKGDCFPQQSQDTIPVDNCQHLLDSIFMALMGIEG